VRTLLHWVTDHFGALLLAFILALVVWISAVITADPNEERVSRSVEIDIVGLDPGLLLVEDIPDQARLTLEAPRSIWDKLNSDQTLIKAWIDLSGLPAGEHEVEVKSSVNASPVRYVKTEPETIRLTLEPLLQRTLPIQPVITGGLPVGYQRGEPVIEPGQVTVSGPQSQVNRVSQARVLLNIAGASESIDQSYTVQLLDENGAPVPNIQVSPADVSVKLPIRLLGGFKNAAVKVVTKGQVADGYRLTSISVSPPTVTLFSDNPDLIDQIPGYVETLPVDLSNLSDDVEISTGLNLPENVTLVREPSVLVQVGVAALEGSLTLTVPVEAIGLAPELVANISPASVDVIVSGPLNYLDQLSPANFRVVVDLTDLPPGVYQRQVVVDLQPEDVRVQTTLPESVEVIIELAPTVTPGSNPAATELPDFTPMLTPTPTARP
jgi:YbbR domain-containing protein